MKKRLREPERGADRDRQAGVEVGWSVLPACRCTQQKSYLYLRTYCTISLLHRYGCFLISTCASFRLLTECSCDRWYSSVSKYLWKRTWRNYRRHNCILWFAPKKKKKIVGRPPLLCLCFPFFFLESFFNNNDAREYEEEIWYAFSSDWRLVT